VKKIYIPLFILLLAAAYWVVAPRQEITSKDAKSFDEFASALIQENGIPGMSIAVLRDRQVVHMQGYGFANLDARSPMTPNTPMNIASISKPILGILILQAKDRGKLELDEDIRPYLPFPLRHPHGGNAPITLRQLATHTSGIADHYDPADFRPGGDATVPLTDHLRRFLSPNGTDFDESAIFLEGVPGTVREYSNIGAGMAGAVVEAASEESLAQIAKDDIFGPLGMTNSSWLLADYIPGELATRYEVAQCLPFTSLCASTAQPKLNFLIGKSFRPTQADREFTPYPQFGNPNYPDGGVNSSVIDLTLLAKSLLSEGRAADAKLLSSDSFEEMLKLQLPPAIDDRQRFFWRERYGLIGHAGSDLGVFSSFYFDEAEGDAIIVLMNRSPDLSTEDAMEQIYQRAGEEFLGKANKAN